MVLHASACGGIGELSLLPLWAANSGGAFRHGSMQHAASALITCVTVVWSSKKRDEGYKGSVLCLVLAGLIAVFLVVDLDSGSGPARLRGLAVVQQACRWLLVEPLGTGGAIALVMAIGIGAAFHFRPAT